VRLAALRRGTGKQVDIPAYQLGRIERRIVTIVTAEDDDVVVGLASSKLSACGRLVTNVPPPQASSGLPSPVMKPIRATMSSRAAADSGGNSRAAASAMSLRLPNSATTRPRCAVGARNHPRRQRLGVGIIIRSGPLAAGSNPGADRGRIAVVELAHLSFEAVVFGDNVR